MKILFIDSTSSLLLEKLRSNNMICDVAYKKKKSEIEKIIYEYDGIVIRSKFKIDRLFIKKAKKLKFIARAGVGMENIDVKYAQENNILCINSKNANSQAVAEHTLGMILSLFKNINKSHQEVKSKLWLREENRGLELSGKTIGIIGFGNTGSTFSKILEGFNVKILAYDKYLLKHQYKSSMKKIYENADLISLHIPLTKETFHLLNDNFIDKFQKPFFLINTSRGKCVSTKSLVKAIKNKKILGACLDVLEIENNSFENISQNANQKELNYLINSNKVILTPHIAGWTNESKKAIAETISNQILTLQKKSLSN